MDKISGFVAYPSEPVLIGQTINGSIQNLTLADQLNIKSWEEMDIPGRFIHTEVMSAISASDFLIGDISILNFNVVFEIGYAIGVGKRVITIRNRAISEDKILIKGIGIFDGLGHKSYSDS